VSRKTHREFASAHEDAQTPLDEYRLATYINSRTGKVYIRYVMTPEEYSREDWKKP
jgi:hypothetical protein